MAEWRTLALVAGYASSLRTHRLKGSLAECFASLLSREYRIVFVPASGRITFIDIGTNDDSWTGATSGASGKTSSAINQQTVYSLQCSALDSSTYQESTTVNLVPAYQEK